MYHKKCIHKNWFDSWDFVGKSQPPTQHPNTNHLIYWREVFPITYFQNLIGGLEHFLFSHILGIIIPTDFHIFQRGRSTTNQTCFSHVLTTPSPPKKNTWDPPDTESMARLPALIDWQLSGGPSGQRICLMSDRMLGYMPECQNFARENVGKYGR